MTGLVSLCATPHPHPDPIPLRVSSSLTLGVFAAKNITPSSRLAFFFLTLGLVNDQRGHREGLESKRQPLPNCLAGPP